MLWVLDPKSLLKLRQVHLHLQKLVEAAVIAAPTKFVVFEGMRSLERQKLLVAEGKSKTMNSRHLTGHAVDLVPLTDGEIDWRWPSYVPLAEHIKAIAKSLNQPIEWGGDWKKFPDGPHWQLPWSKYPKE